MIVLNLSCSNSHSFEGWFASLEEFQRQAEVHQITCPHCNNAIITKLPSGSHVRRAAPEKTPDLAGSETSQAKILTALEDLLRDSENVASRFPEEARKIHYAEAPPRRIHGTASIDEVHALLDEDIAVVPLPNLLRKDIH
ncbi:MAG: DUF1178 family protein [Sterolibacterium sp.]|nr:DUF1178 family protein [Sterolibacterium sp.]